MVTRVVTKIPLSRSQLVDMISNDAVSVCQSNLLCYEKSVGLLFVNLPVFDEVQAFGPTDFKIAQRYVELSRALAFLLVDTPPLTDMFHIF